MSSLPGESLLLASIGTVLLDVFESPSSEARSSEEAEGTSPQRPQAEADRLQQTTADYQAPQDVQIGGGALYALIGARIWVPPTKLRTVIDRAPDKIHDTVIPSDLASDDLPPHLERQINHFGAPMWVYNRRPGLQIPRARIGYVNGVRTYAHLVAPVKRTGAEIAASSLAGAEWLHVSPPYSPSDLLRLIGELDMASEWRPKIVFEPAPPSCHPGQRVYLERVMARVDILSPNHEELLAVYSVPLPEDVEGVKLEVEKIVTHLLEVGVGESGRGIVALRCGPLGCCIGQRTTGIRWASAFFSTSSGRVKDVTGAGNAFIGGYIAGLYLSGGDAYDSALYGTVSASFIVEQLGLPELRVSRSATGKTIETWNGELPEDRLAALQRRSLENDFSQG